MKCIAAMITGDGSIYIDERFFDKFTDEELTKYNYQKIELTDEQYKNISVEDFSIVEKGIIVFNEIKYNDRLARLRVENEKMMYKNLIEYKIALRYSIKDELAIQRQKEKKPEEFKEYNDYCEQCKEEAKKELNYKE
jgi:hypothetical protein